MLNLRLCTKKLKTLTIIMRQSFYNDTNQIFLKNYYKYRTKMYSSIKTYGVNFNENIFEQNQLFINTSKISFKKNARYYANAYNQNKLIKYYNCRSNEIKLITNTKIIIKEKVNFLNMLTNVLWASYNTQNDYLQNIHIFYIDKPHISFFKDIKKIINIFMFGTFLSTNKCIYIKKNLKTFFLKKQKSIRKNLKKKQQKIKNIYKYTQI